MKNRRSFLLCVTAGFAALAFAASGQEVSAASPATLTGEAFTGTLSNLQGTCQSGQISFDTTGVASGPYVGTYTAHVEIQSAATPFKFPTELDIPPFTVFLDASIRSITTFDESFEIRAVDGTILVTGAKTHVLPAQLYCTDEAFITSPVSTATVAAIYRISLEPSLAYSATIQTPSGDYRDEGVANELSQFIAVPNPASFEFNTFSQTFMSLLTTPIPPPPTDADACKNGGWRGLRRSDGSSFKNQGDCIQYVNTGK
jgi:hypothetical protein